MAPVTTLAMEAQALFEKHWRERVASAGEGHSVGRHVVDLVVVTRMLDDLVLMLDQAHYRPAAELAPTIRLLIIDHDFVDDGGDAMSGLSLQTRVDEWVDFFVELLEELRQNAFSRGQWCEHEAAIPMCG